MTKASGNSAATATTPSATSNCETKDHTKLPPKVVAITLIETPPAPSLQKTETFWR